MSTKRPRQPGRLRPAVGWREWVALPDLGVPAIKVKVDTGARSSSLHAFDMEELDVDGVTIVRFSVHPLQRSGRGAVIAEAPLVEHRVVRNPGGGGGSEELRPVVTTTIELAEEQWPIELTLTRRDAMGFRMLLGRQAVRRRFVVDPARSFVHGRKPNKKGAT